MKRLRIFKTAGVGSEIHAMGSLLTTPRRCTVEINLRSIYIHKARSNLLDLIGTTTERSSTNMGLQQCAMTVLHCSENQVSLQLRNRGGRDRGGRNLNEVPGTCMDLLFIFGSIVILAGEEASE